jgi:putative NIF3 family GTP cyclohydrolase 1 type 2
MRLEELVRALDAYFRTLDVENDDWSDTFGVLYPDPYWQDYAEPGYEDRWNGLMVRGADRVDRVVTCVFPSDRIVAGLEPGAFLFSEHPVDLEDEPGFLPLARTSFEAMRDRGVSFYHVHAPLDMHAEVSPSRLCAAGLGLAGLDEYYPIADGITGGAAIIGDSALSLDRLVGRLGAFLGPEIPVTVVSHPRERADRVAVVAGGGADRDILVASLDRGCTTYVTGNAATRCRVDLVREAVHEFLALAAEEGVAVIDATHYGMEKPPQLAMAEWFRGLGLDARFMPDGPK